MKTYIYCCLFLCLTSNIGMIARETGDKAVSIKGTFNKEYRNVRLSEEIMNYLFIKEHALINLNDDFYSAYFIDLDTISARKINKDVILVLFTDGYRNYGKTEVEADVLPVHPDLPNVFYVRGLNDKSPEERRKDPLYRFWENPTERDTVSNLIISLPESYVPLYINALDKPDTIYAETVGYKITETDCIPLFGHRAFPIAETAREGLKPLRYYKTFNPPNEKASQAVWKKWYDQLPDQLDLIPPSDNYTMWSTRPRKSVWSDLFAQKGDSIFGYTSDSLFILNTNTCEFTRTTPDEYEPMPRFEDGDFYEEQQTNAATKKIYSILGDSDYSGKWRYVKSKNGDLIVAKYDNTKFQQLLKLHRIKNGTRKLSQGIVIDTMIPVDEDYFYRMKVVGLFETKTGYIVISRVGTNKYWYLIDKDAFK